MDVGTAGWTQESLRAPCKSLLYKAKWFSFGIKKIKIPFVGDFLCPVALALVLKTEGGTKAKQPEAI